MISLDLETVTREFLDKSRKLRKERIHLIIKHVSEILINGSYVPALTRSFVNIIYGVSHQSIDQRYRLHR